MPEPEPALVAAAAEEPTLFEELDVNRAAAEDLAEDIFADEEPQGADDNLPPPAYKPQVAAFEPTPEPEAFVAPRAPAPGTPSPEALARLRAAAQKAAPNRTPQEQVAEPAPQSAEKPRFGINSLINRMTGINDSMADDQRPARQQPLVQGRSVATPAPAPKPAEAVDPDQERIEIPAFLRRQAN